MAQIVLCVPGPWPTEPDLVHRLPSGVEYEFSDSDDAVTEAFALWARPWSIEPSEVEAVAEHRGVLYLVSRRFSAERAQLTSLELLRCARTALAAGGLAVKCESSGTALGPSGFARLLGQAEASAPPKGRFPADGATQRLAYWTALIDAYVALPLRDERAFYTCGMHLLGFPDVSLDAGAARTAFGETFDDGREAAALLHTFCRYVAAERGPSALRDGETFALSPQAPPFRIGRAPSRRYDADDLFHNEQGYLTLQA